MQVRRVGVSGTLDVSVYYPLIRPCFFFFFDAFLRRSFCSSENALLLLLPTACGLVHPVENHLCFFLSCVLAHLLHQPPRSDLPTLLAAPRKGNKLKSTKSANFHRLLKEWFQKGFTAKCSHSVCLWSESEYHQATELRQSHPIFRFI